MGKIVEVKNNSELLLEGCNIVADAVASTMGPKGRNVILKSEFGLPKVTKDGVSVAREITLDGIQGVGASLLVTAANKSNKNAGDGTTTATVLGRAIAKEGFKLVSAGYNPIGLQRGAQAFTEESEKVLKSISSPVNTSEDINNVALVSANNDVEIAGFVRDAFDKAGTDGVVTVEDSRDSNTYIEHSQGTKFDRGFLHHLYITDINRQVAEYEKPIVILVDGKIESQFDFGAMLDKQLDANGTRVATFLKNRALVIIGEFSEDVKQFFLLNRVQAGLQILPIQAPGFGDRQTDNLEDLAVLCNCQVLSMKAGFSLEDITYENLGSCVKITSSVDDTILVSDVHKVTDEDIEAADEKSKPSLIAYQKQWQRLEARKAEIKGKIEVSRSDYDIEKYKERIARLNNGLITIRVGAATEVELKEKRDRYDDAVSAVKASLKDGILPGGGVAYLYARTRVVCPNTDDKDFIAGWNMMYKIFEEPLMTILRNAADKAEYIVSKVSEYCEQSFNMGYDARKKEYVNMIESGIIDPTLVVLESLKNAVSVGTLIFTSSCTVLAQPKDKCDCKH